MSGFAGSSPARKRRRGVSVSRRRSQSLKAECAGLVAGLAVFIVESDALDVGEYVTTERGGWDHILTNARGKFDQTVLF